MIAALFAFTPFFVGAQDDGDADSDPSSTAFSASAREEPWKQEVLVALIGGGVRFRRARFEVGDGAGGTENRSLDTGAYFDFGWHVLVRPMGHRSPRPSVRAVVLQIDGGSGIGLEVEPADTGISLQTNAWRLLGQIGYLFPKDRLQLGGLVGIGGDVFNIDLNSVLPSSRVVYVRLGPATSYEIIRGFFEIRTDFGFRFPFRLGDIEDAFGRDARAFGLDAILTLQGRIPAGFTYAARFGWEYYTLRFSGPTDNVPARGDGGRGHDHAIALQLLVGWSL